MQNIISRETVLSELRSAVADTLRLDEALVQPESSCVTDLGAESLDFLDINYRMEQAFGVKMARHFFLEHAEEIFGEGTAFDDSGRLTERGATLLRLRYGDGAVPGGSTGLDMDDVPALITIDAIADTIVEILATLPTECRCGARAFTTEDGTHIVCGECGEAAAFTDGDQLIRTWLTTVERDDSSS